MKKTFLYYLLIAISVMNVLLGIFGAYHIVLNYMPRNRLFQTTNIMILPIWACIALILIAVIMFYPLDVWRRKMRDESEYDGNGINKKYGNFSNLSASQRRKIEEQKMIATELVLDSATIKKITQKGEKEPKKKMDDLVGLNTVKNKIDEMAARMQFESENEGKKNRKQNKTMHMCFFGPPGTGKTTVARIMTGFLYKYGYIKKNQCVEVDGNFLKGISPGESSKKTQMLIQKSLGGVLFIDEAYSLLQKNGNTYGQESIATIVKAMEDHRGEIVFIFAGYHDEMKELINSNPGIESRIKYYMDFGNYTVQELSDVFRYMANKENFVVSAGIVEKFEVYISKKMKEKNFGNARTVRNILERMMDKHALNIINGVLPQDSRYILEAVDMPDDNNNIY